MMKARTSSLCALWVALAGSACSPKVREPATSNAAQPSSAADAGAIDAPPTTASVPWARTSADVEWMCGQVPEFTGTYSAALDAGRKEAAAKRWANAVAAFEHALKLRKDDPLATSELSWALLQAGDFERALAMAEHAVAVSADPKQKAANHYNAGRAAEALGNLEGAHSHYEASLALRESDAVRGRLTKMTPSPSRSIARATPMKDCQEQPSLEAACDCLGKTAARWGSSFGLGPQSTCDLREAPGKAGALVSVWSTKQASETLAAGQAMVFVVKRGARWSALQAVESSDDVDLTETPRATHVAKVARYEELPYQEGTLFWIQTHNQYSEWSVGEQEVRGSASLTLCFLPGPGSKDAATCTARLPISEWRYTVPSDADGGEERCQAHQVTNLRVTMRSTGEITMILVGGLDTASSAGKYRL